MDDDNDADAVDVDVSPNAGNDRRIDTAGDATAVYVSCEGSGELHVLRLDPASGELTPVQCLAPGGQLMPMALSPDGRFLYAARRSPPLEVLSFAIDPASGALRALGAAPLPESMAWIATDRSGRWLFAASYGGGVVSVGPIDDTGLAGRADQVLPVGPKAHAAVVDPSNRWLLVTSLGNGTLHAFAFDAADGRLRPPRGASGVRPHAGASPRHLVFSRDGRFVYLLGELDGAIDVLAFDSGSGDLRTVQTLSTMPPGAEVEPWAADLHITPDGRFLYSSERRTGTVAAFRVDAADGRLASIGHASVEAPPRGFCITPDGRHLVVAGQRSNHVGVHAIDAATGELTLRSRHVCGVGPNWVESRQLAGRNDGFGGRSLVFRADR